MTVPDHLFVSSTDGALYDTRAAGWNKLPPLRDNYERHHREIGTVADLKASLRAGPYAWPGGYEVFYIAADGGCLCHDCVKAEFRQIIDAIQTNALRSGWAIGATMHTGETDAEVSCDHCNRVLVEESE